MEDKVKELTLMLLYLTSWQENEYGFKYTRSWKGYNFNILDKLYEQDYIAGSKRAKSVGITEEGIEKARQLLEKYGIKE